MTLSWHTKNAVKSAASYRRQFYGVFLSFSRSWCTSLIFKTIPPLHNLRHVFVSSKTVQNACKTVNLASWNSQSCSPTLTILQPHFDYFAASLWLFRHSKHSKWHSEEPRTTLQTMFSAPENMISVCSKECKKVSVPGNHSDYLFFALQHHTVTTISANRQFLKHWYFVEITLSPWFLPLTCGFHGDTCAFFPP